MNSLEDMLAEMLRQEIDREIREEIAVNHFVEQGWVLAETSLAETDGIGPWMQENIKGDWRGFTARWVFKDPNDAVLFKMRWG